MYSYFTFTYVIIIQIIIIIIKALWFVLKIRPEVIYNIPEDYIIYTYIRKYKQVQQTEDEFTNQ